MFVKHHYLTTATQGHNSSRFAETEVTSHQQFADLYIPRPWVQ